METLLNNQAYLWLTFGALLVLFEAVTAPGLGIFLGGLGAICTGIIIESGLVPADATPLQFACFFGFTTIWAIALWRPLLKFRAGKGKGSAGFNIMVGETATVGERGLRRGEMGQVLWSGTVMNAEIDDAAKADFLPAGSHVIIKSVSGNILRVEPK